MNLIGCDECGEVLAPGTPYVNVTTPTGKMHQIHLTCGPSWESIALTLQESDFGEFRFQLVKTPSAES